MTKISRASSFDLVHLQEKIALGDDPSYFNHRPESSVKREKDEVANMLLFVNKAREIEKRKASS